MKLLIVLSVIACGYAAKLDRTYLPPTGAGTSGGSPGSLNTPLGPSGFGQPAGFGQPRPNTGFSTGQSSGPFSGNNGPSNQYIQPGSTGQVAGSFDAGFGAPAQNFGNQDQDYQRSQPQRAQASAEQSAEILRSENQNDGETYSYSFETSNGISAEESGVATNGVQAQGAFAYSGDDGQTFRVQYTADENGYQPQGDHLPTSPPIPEEILKSIEENARAAASGTQEGAYNPDEDNNEVSPQQYNRNAPTSYNQASAGQNGFSQAGKPAQLYGAPNAGRPQGFSQGPQSQQYNAGSGAPNGGSARPSGFGQAQSPSQLYGSPSTGAANGAARPNSFGQQGSSQSTGPSGASNLGSSSQYSSGPSGALNFGSSSQARPQQYQASPSGQSPSGRPQETAQVQGASGYQYNKPQGGFGGNSNNPTQQYRPQNGASSAQGYSRPSGNAFPSSGSNGQGSFGTNPSSQSYGSAPTSNSQGGFNPTTSGPKGPSSFGSNSQASFGPSAKPNSFGSSSSQSAFGASGGQSSFGASGGQSSFGSSGGPSFGSSGVQSSFGPSADSFRPQAPGSNGQGFSRPQGASAAKSPMPDSGYEYNRPSGNSQFSGSQNGNGPFGSSPQAGQERPGQFGGARAPPSFSEEEGYKY